MLVSPQRFRRRGIGLFAALVLLTATPGAAQAPSSTPNGTAATATTTPAKRPSLSPIQIAQTGTYELTATPFAGPNASGTAGAALAITFTVEAATETGAADAADRVEVLPTAPNPFRDRTTVRFRLPAPTRVHVAVYTLLGTQVAVLADGVRAGGLHAVTWEADWLASGLYLLRVATPQSVETQKLTLVR